MNNLSVIQGKITKTANGALKELASIRQQIIDCDDECEWLRSAPLPLGDVIENIDRFISQNAAFPGLKQFFYAQELNDKPFTVESQIVNYHPLHVVGDLMVGHHSYNVDISSMICSLFPDVVKKALVDLVTQEAENVEAGPPLAERTSLIRAAKQRRHELEVMEEALICQAEEAGLEGFYRRHDCNPEIVLMRAA